jgi:hypothetical protein
MSGIARELVERVLQSPQQMVPEVENVTCYQSRVDMNGKEYLLRVMVNETITPAKVVTVYRTSKVTKYWRAS